jgi:RHS repeat-associated protein
MITKKIAYKIATVIFLVVYCPAIHAQYIGEDLTLNNNYLGNKPYTFQATKTVKLSPGFYSKPEPYQNLVAKINKDIIIEPGTGAISTDPVSPDYPLNKLLMTSAPVGSISGKPDISSSGAFTYNVPLEIPAGVAGMAPKLALSYNSLGGDGIIGLGWSIGLSSISFVRKNLFLDGEQAAFRCDDSDPIELDGQRLVRIDPSNPGLDGNEFRTMNETFTKITVQGTGVDRWFKVETKDGHVLEYGSSADSRYMLDESTPIVCSWMVKKETDLNGNYVRYNYNNRNGEIYISNIEYTGNDGVMPPNVINFEYEQRPDAWSGNLVMNRRAYRTVRLNRIVVNTEQSKVSAYSLRYTNDFNNMTVLAEITREDDKGNKLNSTQFTWSTPTQVSDANIYTHLDLCWVSDAGVNFQGDFDGDGHQETVYLDPCYGWSMFKIYDWGEYFPYRTGWQPLYSPLIYGQLESQFRDALKAYDTDYGLDVVISYLMDQCEPTSYLTGDFNGDGKTEIMVVVPEYTMKPGIYGTLLDYMANKWSYPTPRAGELPFSVLDYFLPANYTCYIMGMEPGFHMHLLYSFFSLGRPVMTISHNNDGRDQWIEIPQLEMECDQLEMEMVLGASYSGPCVFYKPRSGGDNNLQRYYWAGGGRVCGWNKYNMIDDYGVIDENYYNNLYLGDFNSDGIPDGIRNNASILGVGNLKGGYGTRSVLSTAAPGSFGFDESSNFKVDVTNGRLAWYRAVTGDFDGDGYQDVALFKNEDIKVTVKCPTYPYSEDNPPNPYCNHTWQNTTTLDRIIFLHADGTSETRMMNKIINYFQWRNIYDARDPSVYRMEWLYQVGDFTGDGIDDILVNGGVYSFAKGMPGRAINGIVNGLNDKTTIIYSPSYLTGIPHPIYVCQSIANTDATGLGSVSLCTFSDPIRRRGDLEFMGFAQTAQYCSTPQRGISSVKELDSATYTAKKLTTTINDLRSSSLTTTVDEYAFKQLDTTISDKYILRYLAKTTTTNNIDGQTSVTNYAYDDDGNITNASASLGGGISAETIYSGYVNAGSYIPNKATTITTVKKHPDDNNSFSSSVGFLYNSNGNLISKTSNLGIVGKEVTMQYSDFNGFGQPQAVTRKADGVADETETYTYDVTSRFLLSKTTWMGTSNYAYDTRLGLLTSETDVLGHSNTYTYGAFGQLNHKILADGTTQTIKMEWANGSGPTNALYFSQINTDGKAWTKTFYDSHGWVLREETVGFNNLSIYTDYQYSTGGLLESKLLHTGSDVKTVSYLYDNYGRVSQESHSPGNTITYVYLGMTTSSSTNGKTYSRTLDAAGYLTSTTEPSGGGSVSYKYFSSGQLREVNTPSSTVTMTYDDVGNRLTLNDPNAGPMTYTYDGLGRIKTQTDANQKTKTLFYDDHDRIDYELNSENIRTSYTYITDGNGKGQVQSISRPDGTSSLYTYDGFGRVLSATEQLNGWNKTFSYHYNQFGAVDNVTYPGGFVVTRQYDGYGNLVEVAENGGSIWRLNAANASTSKYTFGNGQVTQKDFDSNGFLSSIATAKGSVVAQNLAYTFDVQTGNMTKRLDKRFNLEETFIYDNIDRLTQAQVTGLQVQSVTYSTDGGGNIGYKTGAGTLLYESSKPCAVSSVTNPENPLNSLPDQVVRYTDFNKVASITEGSQSMVYTYGVDQQRRKVVLTENDAVARTNYYFGLYEAQEYTTDVTKNKELFYIEGGEGVAAVLVSTSNGSAMYYIHKDAQGSIVCLTDANGNIAEEYGFDAWGRRRNPVDWTYNNVSTPAILTRGYTGHEHIDEFGIINMNGRLYDPLLGRFLSTDNFVQDPSNSQNYNRYTYCLNNPLKYVDPSGFSYMVYNPSLGLWVYSDNYNNSSIIDQGGSQPGGQMFSAEDLGNYIANGGDPKSYYSQLELNNYSGYEQAKFNAAKSFIWVQYNFKTPDARSSNGYAWGVLDMKVLSFIGNSVNSEGVPSGQGGNGSGLDIVSNIVSSIKFGSNFLDANGSSGIDYAKTGISALNTGLTGYKVYKQYAKGGLSNINPVDATSYGVGTIGIATKVLSMVGYGGQALSFIGTTASNVGLAITISKLWNNIYKPMNDLRYAPTYIDHNGVPFYGDPVPGNEW